MVVVQTASFAENLSNAEAYLKSNCCVLLQGAASSGKSVLAGKLAELHKATFISINLDDTFDSKDLLGKFSAKDTPGVFEWVAGPLTKAVMEGSWIVLEDVDLASFDVFTMLLPLMSTNKLFIADKGITLQAHPSFRLIATQQIMHYGEGSVSTKKGTTLPSAEMWPTVVMVEPTNEEKVEVARTLYPSTPIEPLQNLLLQLPPRKSGLRDILKWARRCSLHVNINTTAQNNGFLASGVREKLFCESVDCFVAGLVPGEEQVTMWKIVAGCCGVDEGTASSLMYDRKPEIVTGRDSLTVGRVALPTLSPPTQRFSRVAFAETKHAMSLVERICMAVNVNEPVLLTGETGVGKTFIVQYVADNIGQELVVHNLNQQTDSSDFMGGWKPKDVSQKVRSLYSRFIVLLEQRAAGKHVTFVASLNKAMQDQNWESAVMHFTKGAQSVRNADEYTPIPEWEAFAEEAEAVSDTVRLAKTTFMFGFEEGTLVSAWRQGHWILLDEINLASTEVLERLATVLDGSQELVVTEKGGTERIPRHPNFRVFANMNPPTDVGKKDLPPSLKSRFTEFYVSDPFDPHDLTCVVTAYLSGLCSDAKVNSFVSFFLEVIESAGSKLCDLGGDIKPPHFSLRTLTRALTYIRKATPLYGFNIAIFDGLTMSFASPLQRRFHIVVEKMIVQNMFGGSKPNSAVLPKLPADGKKYVPYEHVWLEEGPETPRIDERFILTSSVREHLKNISRAVFAKRPVLLEGPTSAGKSSMVQYLAELTGHTFVRINNHDSTEIQEYLGHYVSDESGKLRFVDGCLTSAVRNGHWVVLDELNLAPTEVLEALNRLLDDNCELFLPDTNETIHPHPSLRIFATQNPSGAYGGRKVLSRAFRNRFLEITVDDIPTDEITEILCKRYSLAPSFAERMVEVMNTLQMRRQSSHVFAGRHGFITPRDLFRWAERRPEDYQALAEHGFLLLGERCRKPEERQVVHDVMEKCMKVILDANVIYDPTHWPFVNKYYQLVEALNLKEKIVWTNSMQRLFTIVGLCLEHKEPVLLVGETGSSKTTICQVWAAVLEQHLHIINCHQHSEAADFLGSLRPAPPGSSEGLFRWEDGPLVRAMRSGDIFVLDEISLAEDSVLERLNSVLEPSRTLTLAEKSTGEMVVAAELFRALATMNPGGDFGKKELSPALRNRFTEVYVQPITDKAEIALILGKRMSDTLLPYAAKMADVLHSVAALRKDSVAHISVRDVVAWAEFMVATEGRCEGDISFVHGLDTVLLDGLSVGGGLSETSVEGLRAACMEACMKHVTTAPNVLQTPFWNLCTGIEEPVAPKTKGETFFFSAPTTRGNCSKILRGCVLKKAIMLEGSPGVGKTSIVEALGRAFNKFTVRINLSEQTDMMDLLGAFLPRPSEESDDGPRFEWCDGVLLSAVKAGHWVVLDELNLASQSVLEGLNALLDHRSSLYIPELCCEVTAHPDFRVFACQNPLVEGGGRKGLPKSFLNRFTKVRISAFTFDDLICIAKACTTLNDDLLHKMVQFVCELQKATMEERRFGMRGSPWEFNLRDVLRWAGMVSSEEAVHTVVDALFFQRFRSYGDRLEALKLYNDVFSIDLRLRETVSFTKEDGWLYGDNQKLALPVQDVIGNAPLALPGQSSLVESVVRCAVANQFCILVGPASSGKTSILHSAAALLGVELETFSVTAGCDTIDLLGGYDQVEGRQGQFEWRDSLLLKAMVEGKWLVLDNANFCSASVLDRLNSVVEPHGSLLVNEQGLVDGVVRIVRPHPNFRIFATLDTKFGEISRALRNRAVELFVPPPSVPGVDAYTICAHHDACADLDPTGVARILSFHREYVKTCYHADTDGTSTAAVDLSAIGAPSIVTVRRTLGSVDHFGGDISKALEHSYLKMRTATGVRADSLLPLLEDIPISDVSLPYENAVRASDLKNDDSMAVALKRIIYQRACLVLDLGDRAGLLEYFFLRLGGVRVCEPHILLEVLQNCNRATFELNDVVEWCGAVTPGNVVGALASIDGTFGTTKGLMKAVTGSGMPPALVQAIGEMDTALCAFYSQCFKTEGSDALSLIESSLLFRAAYQTLAGKFSTNTADAVQLLAQLLVAFESVNEKAFVPAAVAIAVRNVFDVLRRISNLSSDLAPPPTLLVKGGHPAVKRQAERALLAEASVALKEYQDSRPHSERLLEALWGTAAGRSELEILSTMLRMLRSSADPAHLSGLIADHTNTFLHTVPLLTEMEAAPLQVVSANVATQGAEWLAASIAELWTVGKVLPSETGSHSLTAGAWVGAAAKVVRSVRNATVRDTTCLADSNAFRSLTGLQRAVNSLIEPVDATVVLSGMCKSILMWLVGIFVSGEVADKSVAGLVNELLNCDEPVIKACSRVLEEVPELLADNSGAIGVHLALAVLYWMKAQLVVPTSLIDPALKQAIIFKAIAQQNDVWDEIAQTFLQTDSEVYGLATASPYSTAVDEIATWGKERAREEKRKYVPRDDETGARFVEMVVFERELLEGMLNLSRISRFRATALQHCPHLKKKNRVEEGAAGGVDELRSWSSLLRQASQEMARRFGGYEDFTIPFQECLSVIALAADLAAQAAEAQQQELPLDSNLICHALTFPQLAPALAFPALSLENNVGEQLTLLDGALADLCSSPWRVPDSEREGLFTAFCNVHSAIDALVKSEALDEELAVMYKEKAILIEDDDEKHRRNLLKMFPNYQQEFENLDDEEDEDADPEAPTTAGRGMHARMLLNEDSGRRLRSLVDSHNKVYFALLMREFDSLTVGGSPLGCFKERFDAVASLMKGVPFSCTQYEELSILGGFAARAKSLRDQLKAALQPPTSDISEKVGTGFNIYQDAQPNEAADAGKHVGGLMTLIDPLRIEYPENPTLQRIEKLAVRILNYAVESTPLMRIVVGCEVLLRECYEWERNASKAVSIMNSINAISGSVLRWRRLELYCWPHIFIAKKHELRAFAANTWFRMHTFVMQILGGVFNTPDGEFSRSAIAQYASDFMWQSNVADFGLRKQTLTGFGCHLLVRGMSDGIAEALDAGRIFLHTVGFFSQFDTLIADTESVGVAPLEADLKEFCSIMKWEDATYYAVKATTQKSHTKIGRIIGELDDLFKRRLTDLIATKEGQEDSETTLGLPSENPALAAASNRERKRIEAEKLREKRTRKGRKQQQITDDATVAKEGAKRFHSTVWVNAQLSDSIEFANDTAENLVSEIVRMQLPKTPLNLKQRNLKMLLESMKAAGVPLNHEGRLLAWEHVYADGSYVPPLTCMMHTMKQHFPTLFSDGGSDYVKKTYRLVRCIEQLRVAERLPHDDLTMGQARRGSAMCESLVRFVMDAAHALHTVGEVRETLSLCVAAVESTAVGPVVAVNELPYGSISSMAADIVTYAAQVRWMMGSSSVTSVLNQLSASAAALQKAASLIAERLMSSAYVAGQLEESNIRTLCSETDAAMQILEKAELPEYLRAPLVQLRNSLSAHLISTAAPSDAKKASEWESAALTNLKSLRDVIHSHKVDLPPVREPKVVVEVEGVDAEEEESEADEINDDSVVQKGCKVLADLVVALEGASPLLNACYQSNSRILPTEAAKSALLREVRDMVQEVDAMAYWVLQYQEGLSWLALVLLRLWTALLKRGFCKPDEEEGDGEGDGGEGQQQDGTGMDDGKGENDVTDQLDNEDQLMNMKDKEENKEDQGEDDEDKAAEVATDFEADKERREESEEDSGTDGDDDDESDKEMGDVDAEDVQEKKKARTEKKEQGKEDEGGEAEEVPEDDVDSQDGEEMHSEGEEGDETKDYGNKEKEIREADSDRESNSDQGEVVGDNEDAAFDEDSGSSGEKSDDDGEGSDKSVDGSGDAESDDDGSTDENKDEDDKGSKEGDDAEERSEEDPDRQEDAEQIKHDQGADSAESGGDDDDDKVDDGEGADKNDHHHGEQDDQAGKEETDPEKERDRKRQRPEDSQGAENEEQDGAEQEEDDAGRSWKKQDKNLQSKRKDTSQQQKQSEKNPFKALKEAMQRHKQRTKQLNLDKNVKMNMEDNEKLDDKDDNDGSEVEEDGEFEITAKGKDEGMAPIDELPDITVAEDDINDAEGADNDGDENGQQAPRDKRVKRDDDKKPDNVDVKDDRDSKKKKDSKKGGKVSLQAEMESDEESIPEEVVEPINETDRMAAGRELWYRHEAAVQVHAQQLCEQLRLILAPTDADKLQGDYKTGKRINIKKIIPYIASQFKKDRIWLRRTRPNKRKYQVVVAVDDSLSMQLNNAGDVTCQAVALLSKTMQQLEVGEFGVLSLGADTEIAHPLAEPFTAESGPRTFSHLTFEQKSTNMRRFLEYSLDYLDAEGGRLSSSIRSNTTQLRQLMFVISDGQITEDRTELRKLMTRAEENGQMVVLIILDVKAVVNQGSPASPSSPVAPVAATIPDAGKKMSVAEKMRQLKAEREARLANPKAGSSVLEMQVVEFVGSKVIKKAYLHDFPFPYYIVVQDIPSLPMLLADAMKQWFELIRNMGN